MSALSEETRFKRLKASDADQAKPAVRDGFAAPMRDRRTERGCDDLDAEGAAARRKRREAVSRLQSLIVSGFEQKSVAIAMHVWAQHFADEHALEGNEEELRLKRKKRKQERKRWIKMMKTEDGAAAGCHVDASEADRFEILWLSFRRMGRTLGVYFRIAVTDAILGRYFSDGDDARGGGAGETAAAEIESMATVLIKSCGPDAIDAIRTAYDKLMDGNTNECVRSMALKHLFDAAETAANDDAGDDASADEWSGEDGGGGERRGNTSRNKASARTGKDGDVTTGRWTLCSMDGSLPLGFVIGDNLAATTQARGPGGQPPVASRPFGSVRGTDEPAEDPEASPTVSKGADVHVDGGGGVSTWTSNRPISSASMLDGDFAIGIL